MLVRPPKNKFHQIMRHLQCATSKGNNFSGPAISLRALWREYSRIPIQLHLSIKFSRLDFLRGHREFFSYCLLPKKRRRSRKRQNTRKDLYLGLSSCLSRAIYLPLLLIPRPDIIITTNVSRVDCGLMMRGSRVSGAQSRVMRLNQVVA